jgi:hypothetical protein
MYPGIGKKRFPVILFADLSVNPGRPKKVDVTQILADLKAEREQLDNAIVTLERLARGQGKRRGRPPAWMAADKPDAAPVAKRRGRPPGSKNKVRPRETGQSDIDIKGAAVA